MRTLPLQPLLEHLVSIFLPRICDYGRQPISLLSMFGSMKTGSPTFKFGRCIVAAKQLNSITQDVQRTISAMNCRHVTGCLGLHYTCLGCMKALRAKASSSDTGLALSLLSCLLKVLRKLCQPSGSGNLGALAVLTAGEISRLCRGR